MGDDPEPGPVKKGWKERSAVLIGIRRKTQTRAEGYQAMTSPPEPSFGEGDRGKRHTRGAT